MTTADTVTNESTPDSVPAYRESLVLRIVAATERASLIVASVALIGMTLLMVLETVLRYVFGAPLGWSFGFIQDYLLPGYFFLALAYTVRSGAHVTIDVLYQRSRPRARAIMTGVGRVLMLAFAALLLWAGTVSTYDVWQSRDIPPPGGADLSIPTWTWHILVPIGATLLTIRMLADVLSRRRPDHGEHTEGTH